MNDAKVFLRCLATYVLLKADRFEGFVIWSKIDGFMINNTVGVIKKIKYKNLKFLKTIFFGFNFF